VPAARVLKCSQPVFCLGSTDGRAFLFRCKKQARTAALADFLAALDQGWSEVKTDI
jgi:hypothetical protein